MTRHRPPPTKFGPGLQAQAKPFLSSPSSAGSPPPPTKFGPAPVQAKPLPVANTRGFAPPPTQFGATPPVQAKSADLPTTLPAPVTKFGPQLMSGALQAMKRKDNPADKKRKLAPEKKKQKKEPWEQFCGVYGMDMGAPPPPESKGSGLLTEEEVLAQWKRISPEDLTTLTALRAGIKKMIAQTFSYAAGTLPGSLEATLRPRKKFDGLRDIQLLRQLSTQISLWLIANKKDPVEVQAAYFRNNIIISTNKNAAADYLADYLSGDATAKLKLILTTDYSELRSDRMSRKIANIYEGKRFKFQQPSSATTTHPLDALPENAAFAKEMVHILTHPFKLTKLNSDNASIAKLAVNTIFVLTDDKEEHAEQKIVKFIRPLAEQNAATRIPVYGRKRPCFICQFKLRQIEKIGIKLDFGQFPGLFFKEQIDFLPIEQAKELYDLLADHLDGNHHVSTYKSAEGGSSYDSGSDSDGEENYRE